MLHEYYLKISSYMNIYYTCIQLIQKKMNKTVSSTSTTFPKMMQCLEKNYVNNVS